MAEGRLAKRLANEHLWPMWLCATAYCMLVFLPAFMSDDAWAAGSAFIGFIALFLCSFHCGFTLAKWGCQTPECKCHSKPEVQNA